MIMLEDFDKKFALKRNVDDVEMICDDPLHVGDREVTVSKVAARRNIDKNDGNFFCRKCCLTFKNPMFNPVSVEKVKKTNLEIYGTEMPINSPENVAARNEKMFGTEESRKAINDKKKATSRKNYGEDHYMKTEEGKKKVRDSTRESLGVDYPMQSEEIRKNFVETCRERYNVDNPAQLPETREKMQKTMEERYGVKFYNQLPEMRDYLRENCRDWLKDSWANPWAKGITRPEEWNQKQSETMSELIQQGLLHIGPKHSKKGFYKSVKCKRNNPMFRSSYEAKVHYYFDNNELVEWYDYEPFQVVYHDENNHLRRFTVDFIVKFYDGNIFAVEVKNNYTKDSHLNNLKYKAFKEQCSFELQVWANEDIEKFKIDFDELVKSEKVVLFD